MTITQTVDIPADRRITLDVPREVPPGPVVLTFTPKAPVTERKKEREFGCVKGDYWMAGDFDAPLDDLKDYMQMNGYLLDTHTAIWFLTGDTLLSPTANRIIREGDNHVSLSIISAWELAIKISIGKLRFPGNAAGFIKAVQDNDIAIIPIKPTYLTTLETLPMIHRDPFDRLLIATALAEQMTLITADENIAKYNVSHIR